MDPPITVTFKPTRRASSVVTRAQTVISVFKVGAFYSLQPTSSSQEVQLIKCLKPSRDYLEGLVLEKCIDDEGGDLVIFEEKLVEQISCDRVHSLVISKNEINSNKYSVDKNEYEQILITLD